MTMQSLRLRSERQQENGLFPANSGMTSTRRTRGLYQGRARMNLRYRKTITAFLVLGSLVAVPSWLAYRPVRQVTPRQPADGKSAGLRGLRLEIRLWTGIPQRQSRSRRSAGLAALALAGGEDAITTTARRRLAPYRAKRSAAEIDNFPDLCLY